MRAALSLLSLAAGAVAGAAPILAAAGSLDGFLIFLAVWGFAPFAPLAVLSRWMTVPGLLLTLLALAAVQWLAVAEYLGSSDGQAGLIFLFLPFYLVVGVLLAWGLDALAKMLARGAHRHRSA